MRVVELKYEIVAKLHHLGEKNMLDTEKKNRNNINCQITESPELVIFTTRNNNTVDVCFAGIKSLLSSFYQISRIS